jgi:hypothetical protein
LSRFGIVYGTRYVDASEKKRNCNSSGDRVHFEIGFLFYIGIYVTYFVYDGFGDIYTKASVLENFHKKTPSEV